MSLTFHWFLPTYGDSRYLVGGGTPEADADVPAVASIPFAATR